MPLFNDDTSLIYAPHPGFASGRYYSSSIVLSTAGLSLGSGFIYYTYFFAPFRQAFTNIAFQLTTTNSTNIRFAIYKVINGLPSGLVRDLGVTSLNAPSGIKEVSAVVTLEAGWYAIAMMLSVNNIGFLAAPSSLTNLLGLLTPSTATNLSGFRHTLSYGSFPPTAPTANIENSPTPHFWLKAA